jgi:hypothetical protein
MTDLPQSQYSRTITVMDTITRRFPLEEDVESVANLDLGTYGKTPYSLPAGLIAQSSNCDRDVKYCDSS